MFKFTWGIPMVVDKAAAVNLLS